MDKEQIINDIIELLEKQSTNSARLEILNQITEKVCIHCGSFGDLECNCWNDE